MEDNETLKMVLNEIYCCNKFGRARAVSRSLRQRHGWVVAWCRVGGPECSRVCMGTFEGSGVARGHLSP